MKLRGVFAVSLGNALAFYDLLIFGTFAVQISRDPLAPAYYVLGVLLVGIAGIMLFPETAPGRLMLRKR